jgi:plastocyanin
LDRRTLLRTGGLALVGLPLLANATAAEPVAEIALRSDRDGARVWFDPVGLLVAPGTTVRWTVRENVHTATAYHPANGNRSRRIPDGAAPWDSGYLVSPGDSFSVTLTVPGVYDYFCEPHEHGGMVGRIIVGHPAGPGTRPFDYFQNRDPAPDWLPVPEAARRIFPAVVDIMETGVVRAT